MASASLLILVDSLSRCLSPGLKVSSDVDFDLPEKTLSLRSFAFDEVDELVMTDDVSEVPFDPALLSDMLRQSWRVVFEVMFEVMAEYRLL